MHELCRLVEPRLPQKEGVDIAAFERGHHLRRLHELHFDLVHRQIVFLHVTDEVEVPAGGARIGDGPADQVFRPLDIVASSKADLLPAGGRVGGHVELAALVPAREPAEFGGGTYIRAAGEKRVEGDVAVVERLVAGLQPVLFKDLELGRDHEWDEKRVDSRRGWHFFQRRAVRDSYSQHVHARPQRHTERPSRHSPRIAAVVHTFPFPLYG